MKTLRTTAARMNYKYNGPGNCLINTRHFSTEHFQLSMKVKRQLITTVETERTLSIKISKLEARFFCQSCGCETEMIALNSAVNLTQKNWREVIDQADIGGLHFMETTKGEIYFCSVSVSDLPDC